LISYRMRRVEGKYGSGLWEEGKREGGRRRRAAATEAAVAGVEERAYAVRAGGGYSVGQERRGPGDMIAK